MNNHQEELQTKSQYEYITEDDLKVILTKYGYAIDEIKIQNYEVNKACENKMLGFLSDHLILKVVVISNDEPKTHCFFIKAMSQNAGKALFASSLNLFQKEVTFYEVIKRKIQLPGLKPWCGKLVAHLEHAVVFEDLASLQYQMRSKDIKFDKQHTLEALRTLARFHANSIIYEETMAKKLNRPYRLYEEYGKYLDVGHFNKTNPWFCQSGVGALEAVKEFSKYKDDKDLLKKIEDRWNDVWNSALNYDPFSERSVICHRDLWNNNLLFHYKKREDGSSEPDDCILVDFQAISYQPPAADVMYLIYANLEPKFRKEHTDKLLDFYFNELKDILWNYGAYIEDIIPKVNFLKSAKEHNLWGLVVYSAMVQCVGLDDCLTLENFSEAAQFEQIIFKDRSTYIKAMFQKSYSYKQMIMELFEELVEQFVLMK